MDNLNNLKPILSRLGSVSDGVGMFVEFGGYWRGKSFLNNTPIQYLTQRAAKFHSEDSVFLH